MKKMMTSANVPAVLGLDVTIEFFYETFIGSYPPCQEASTRSTGLLGFSSECLNTCLFVGTTSCHVYCKVMLHSINIYCNIFTAQTCFN